MIQNSNELYHYGVLGMRWGRRRYQNRYGIITKAGYERGKQLEEEYDALDGTKTITPKGLKRKAQIAEEYKQLTGKSITAYKAQLKKDEKKSDVLNPPVKEMKDMTNEELQAHNTRKQLENTYLSLQPKPGIPPAGKRVEDMSNEELQAYNTRKQLETAYQGYQPKPAESKVKKFVGSVMTKVIAPVAIKAGQAYLSKRLGLDKKDADEAAKKTADAAKKATEEATKKAAESATKDTFKTASDAFKRATENASVKRSYEDAMKKAGEESFSRFMASEEARKRGQNIVTQLLLTGPTL